MAAQIRLWFLIFLLFPSLAFPSSALTTRFEQAVSQFAAHMYTMGLIPKRRNVQMQTDLLWDPSPQWGQAFTFKDRLSGQNFTLAFFPIEGTYSATSDKKLIQQAKLVTVAEDFILFLLPPFSPRKDLEKILGDLKFEELEKSEELDPKKEIRLGRSCEEAILKPHYLSLTFGYKKAIPDRYFDRLSEKYHVGVIMTTVTGGDRHIRLRTQNPVRESTTLYSKEEVKAAYDELQVLVKNISGYHLKVYGKEIPNYEPFRMEASYSPHTLKYLYYLYTQERERLKNEFSVVIVPNAMQIDEKNTNPQKPASP